MLTKPDSTRIILSGTEAERFFDTAYTFARCRDMLVSFLYAEQKGSKWFQDRCKKRPDIKWTVDSGAHSFRSEGYNEKWPDLAWFDDYAVRYRDWILANKGFVNFVVNLDVDTPCGMANMLRWDNEIFRPLERAGVPVCYVWHEQYGFDYWLKMCREHEFVGLPGHLAEAEWHKYMKPAIMNGCRVHGFAATKSFILGKVPLTSADSISWKAGEMYGQTFVFEGGRLRTYDKTQKDARLKYKARWVSMGVDWAELEQDKASEITKVCAIAWGDYQDHVSTMTRKLAYWNKTSQQVDEFVQANGASYNNLTKDLVAEFFTKLKVPLEVTSDSQAQTDLKEIRAFLARDCETVFAFADDRIAYWLKVLALTPENDSRAEKEAEIRQALYKWFYKIQAAEAMPRLTEDTVQPVKESEERNEPMRPYATVDVDLPIAPGAAAVEAEPEDITLQVESETMLIGDKTTKQDKASDSAQPKENEGQPGQELPRAGPSQERKPSPDKGFVDEIPDTLLRVRVGYGVDLIFEQNKLKQEATQLRLLRREPKRQKLLAQKAAAIGVELSKITDEAGAGIAAKMQAAADDAFQQWVDSLNPDATAKALAAKTKALPVQAQKLAADPAIARELGRLGGAPKGNQNARKHGLYSPRLPQLVCDNCPHIQVCPQYRAGHVCAFLTEFSTWSSDKQSKELAFLEDMLQSQLVRLRRAMLFETFEGGIVNKEVSKLTRDVANLTKMVHDLRNPPANPFAKTPAPGDPDGKKTSILGDLFKDLHKAPDGSYAAPPAQPAQVSPTEPSTKV